MKESSVNIFLLIVLSVLFLFISAQGHTREPERGVAVDPMQITVKNSRIFYFTVYNDTDNEYVITARVVRADGSGETPFALSPPVRLLNKRDDVKVGLIYLPEKKRDDRERCITSPFHLFPGSRNQPEIKVFLYLLFWCSRYPW